MILISLVMINRYDMYGVQLTIDYLSFDLEMYSKNIAILD